MNSQTRKAVVAGILGNALEWYDFALYGHFSLFIGQTFFPREEPGLAMLAAFAVFSVSFFMRPLGAILFSAIGDRHGRRKALSLSMLGMAIPTAGIGLLPNYADIGYAATSILVLLRLFQGLALGGEMGGAVTYVLEHAPERRVGLASSLIQASTCAGLLLGSLISSGISAALTEAQFGAWGWRIPFLLGLLAAWIGLAIRRRMPESALYEIARSEDRLVRNPILTILALHKRAILLGMAVLTPMTCGFFFAFVYFNSFMMAELRFSPSRSLLVTSLGLILSLSATLLSGWLADRIGYKKVLTAGAGLLLIGAYPIVGWLSGAAGIERVLPAFFAFALLLGIYTSAAFAAVASLFATEIRYSGVSFAVNLAAPLFGSTAPLLAAWLIRGMGVAAGLSWFGGYLSLLFLVAAVAIRRLDHSVFTGWGQTA
jgi:MHS family proline/betaine transporter-like MFS transporter